MGSVSTPKSNGGLRNVTIRYRNGAYEVIVNVGTDPVTGKRRQVSRTVRTAKRRRVPDEVKDVEARLRAEVRKGQHGGARATVAELLERWLAKIRSSKSPNTMHGYDKVVRLYLAPTIGAVRVDKLTAEQLDGLYVSLEAGGGKDGRALSPMTVRHVHAVIRAALAQAVKWGWVDRNVALNAEPSSAERAIQAAPSRADVNALLAKATPDLALLVRLAASTGARRGELCGLRWSDLDLEVGSAVIRRSVWQVGDTIDVKLPKSGKARVIPLGPTIVAALRARLEEVTARAERFGAPFVDGYVLSESVDGAEPLSPNVATARFRRLAAQCGLKVRLHDLRHAAVTWALASGARPRDVAEFAGHASTRMTLEVYGHAMPAGLRHVADALEF